MLSTSFHILDIIWAGGWNNSNHSFVSWAFLVYAHSCTSICLCTFLTVLILSRFFFHLTCLLWLNVLFVTPALFLPMLRFATYNIFIFHFTVECGLLNQERAYCGSNTLSFAVFCINCSYGLYHCSYCLGHYLCHAHLPSFILYACTRL